jgi:hypothetical protein
MNLSKHTIDVLKNFKGINPSILFRPGNQIVTVNEGSSIIGIADVEETFPSRFCIHDLSKFIGAISLFSEPNLRFENDRVVIESGPEKIGFVRGDEASMTGKPRDKDPNFGETSIEFELTQTEFTKFKRGMATLRLPQMAIVGDGSAIVFQAVDIKNPTTDTYEMVVGETDKTFTIYIDQSNLVMLERDYTVSINSGGIVTRFAGHNLTYMVANHKDSKAGNL